MQRRRTSDISSHAAAKLVQHAAAVQLADKISDGSASDKLLESMVHECRSAASSISICCCEVACSDPRLGLTALLHLNHHHHHQQQQLIER